MRDYAEAVLNHLDRREVEYADVRVIESRERNISTKNGKVGTSSSDESLGLGVRVLAQGCWGFASTDDLSKESLAAVAARALAIARSSALAKNADKLEKKVYPVPGAIDRAVARIKLEAMGVHIDRLSPEQEKYLASWSEGT